MPGYHAKTKRFVVGEVKDSIPVNTSVRRPKAPKYPFREMKIGSSFDVTNPRVNLEANGAHGRLAQTLRASCLRYAKMTGKKFIVRQIEGGVRVWRIE